MDFKIKFILGSKILFLLQKIYEDASKVCLVKNYMRRQQNIVVSSKIIRGGSKIVVPLQKLYEEATMSLLGFRTKPCTFYRG